MFNPILKEVVSVLAAALSISSEPGATTHHATPALISEVHSVSPGGTVRMLVTFSIDEHWHLYWDGQNDTGQPPRFTWALPPGWTISEPVFPAPRRNVQPGDIVDYIYEKRFAVGFDLRIPSDCPTDSFNLSTNIEWLECADRCMFGEATVDTALTVRPVSLKARPVAVTEQFDAFDASLPKPFEELKTASLSVSQGSLAIRVPDATRLEFFPGKNSPPLKDPLGGNWTDGELLQITFKADIERPNVDGIVAVYRTKQGPPVYYSVKGTQASHAATEPVGAPIRIDK